MRTMLLFALLGIASGCGQKPEPAGEPKHAPAPAEPVVWPEAGKESVVLKGLEMEILRVGIRPQPDKEYVEVIWLASTKVKEGHFLFGGWREPKPKLFDSREVEYPSLTVPFDISAGKGTSPEDELLADAVRAHGKKHPRGLTIVYPPGNHIRFEHDFFRDGIWRALYFERPPKDTTEWHLAMGGEAFGVQGTFRFRIDPKTVKMLPAR